MLNGIPSHRYMYRAANGPIPKGFDVHHICGEPRCCNPAHCIAVSRADHARLHAFARRSGRRRVNGQRRA